MKLFRKLKKGFTLIELVVVIAVIAVLSAVSVVSYVAITNKAKTSSDEQAVTQMNTILTANDVMDLRSIRDVIDAFAENGLDAEDYKPLMKDRYFFWDADANKIIYTDDEYNVLFPESLKGPKKENSHWLSLSGEINKRDYSSNQSSSGLSLASATATEAGEMLYKFSEDIHSGSNQMLKEEGLKTITLPEKVDLAGSEFNLGAVEKPLTIKGQDAEHPAEIQNFFTSEYQSLGSGTRKGREYHAGLVQKVSSEVTFKDLVIENVSIGDYDIHMSAIFAGSIEAGGKLVVENCTIKNAYVYGNAKVSVFAGTIQGKGSLEIKNCKLENVHIIAEEGCAGAVTGYLNSGTASVDTFTAGQIRTGVTTELHKVSDRVYHTFPGTLTDASAECASCIVLDDNKQRKAEYYSKDPSLRRFKPGCALFGWDNDTANPLTDGSNICDYGLKPLAF